MSIAGPNPTLHVLNLAERMVPDWRISFLSTRPTDDDYVDDAHVTLDREKRTALIRYDGLLDDETLRFLFVHELMHVVLADLVYVASEGQSVNMMLVINMFEERIANKVARELL